MSIRCFKKYLLNSVYMAIFTINLFFMKIFQFLLYCCMLNHAYVTGIRILSFSSFLLYRRHVNETHALTFRQVWVLTFVQALSSLLIFPGIVIKIRIQQTKSILIVNNRISAEYVTSDILGHKFVSVARIRCIDLLLETQKAIYKKVIYCCRISPRIFLVAAIYVLDTKIRSMDKFDGSTF